MEFQNNALCSACYASYQPIDSFCNGCGYPLQGSVEEQNIFRSNRAVKEIELVELTDKVNKASKSLFWIAGIMSISLLVIYFKEQNEADRNLSLVSSLILIFSFIGLGLWSKRRPTTALISGLSLFVIIHVLNAIFEPITIVQGIIMKIIIIGYLINGIKSATETDKLKKELNVH